MFVHKKKFSSCFALDYFYEEMSSNEQIDCITALEL